MSDLSGGRREDPDVAKQRLLLGALESDLEGSDFEQYAGVSRSEARRRVAGEQQAETTTVRGGERLPDRVGKRRLAIGALEDDMGDAEFVSYLGLTRKEARDFAVGELDPFD